MSQTCLMPLMLSSLPAERLLLHVLSRFVEPAAVTSMTLLIGSSFEAKVQNDRCNPGPLFGTKQAPVSHAGMQGRSPCQPKEVVDVLGDDDRRALKGKRQDFGVRASAEADVRNVLRIEIEGREARHMCRGDILIDLIDLIDQKPKLGFCQGSTI